ncbi:MAG: DUF1461 domain-containing protein [Dehalococcoidia bacterium]|nr:DUF1461 domain-containing protein [Dehalococcoidia bacterium]
MVEETTTAEKAPRAATRPWPRGLLRGLFWLWGLALVLSIPIFLITASLRGLVAAPALYEYGFSKYAIAEAVGISERDLEGVVGPAFVRYFRSPEEPLQIRVAVRGQERDLFTEREVAHMRDVKGLVRLDYRLMWGSLAVAVGFVVLGALAARRQLAAALARKALTGAVLTIALLAAVGIGSLVGFEALFLQFHLISFSNDFWQLDPAQHYLIALFPEGFFRDATLLLSTAVLLEAGVLATAAALFLRWRRGAAKRTNVP